jgi:flagellar basal body rod protein FlgB
MPAMIRSLFGTTTDVSMLRGGLEENSATQRGIAARVARATSTSANGDFAGQLEAASAGVAKEQRMSDVDLQQEMAALADTQIRYEASTKLLHEAYGRIRTALRNNG